MTAEPRDAVAPDGDLHERAERELERDRRAERRLFWKGVAVLVLVLVYVWIRQRYFV